jgi:hypothetical protein
MEISNRFISYCGKLEGTITDKIDLDLKSFIYRLILFDTYIIRSLYLKEITALIEIFGIEEVFNLLSSKALRIYFEPMTFIELSPFYKLPEDCYTIGLLYAVPKPNKNVSNNHEDDSLRHKLLVSEHLNNLWIPDLSKSKNKKLKQLLGGVIEPPIAYKFNEVFVQIKKDISENNHLLKGFILYELNKQKRIQIEFDSLKVSVESLDHLNDSARRLTFLIRTNLSKIIVLKDGEERNIVTHAILDISGLTGNIAEMDIFNAISGFKNDEFVLLDYKLNILCKKLDILQNNEDRLDRILKIREFPAFMTDQDQVKISLSKLLEIRTSDECFEFRKWLMKIDELSDDDIRDSFQSMRTKLGIIASGKKYKTTNIAVSTLVGMLPYGTALGLSLAIADNFLINKLLPYNKSVAFVDKLFPSIYKRN